MITLTTPPSVNSVLGGISPVGYNHLIVAPFTMDPMTLLITGSVRLTATSAPTMQAIIGRLTINASTGVLEVEVTQLDFYRRIQLSGAQITSVTNIIQNAQNALENGLVSLGIMAGVQSTGA
jgi:hypothetical protein